MTSKEATTLKKNSFRQLLSLCKDHAKINTRIAFITFQNQEARPYIEQSLMIIDYVQLMSQIILFHYNSWYNNQGFEKAYLVRGIIHFANFMTPGSWAVFDNNHTTKIGALFFMIIFSVLKYLFSLYILVVVIVDIKSQNRATTIWKWIYRVQNRFLYFVTTSFWVKVILDSSQGNFNSSLIDFGKIGNITIAGLLIAIELIFSLFLQIRYCYILPTKSFSSSKDNMIGILNIVQKVMIQVLQMTLLLDQFKLNWITSSLNLIFSLICQSTYFITLPFYNLKALKLQGTLMMVITSLNLACFTNILTQTLGYNINMNFIVVNWFIIGSLGIKLSNDYLNKMITDVLFNKRTHTPELLIHKINIIKQIKKHNLMPSKLSSKCKFSHLMNSTINSDFSIVLSLHKKSQANTDNASKQSLNKAFMHYLEKLLVMFPKNGLIKLYLAYFYAKKVHTYASAIKMIADINNQSHSYKISLNASLLIYEMENLIKVRYTNNKSKINLASYLESMNQVSQLKEIMLNQANIQAKLYEEILKDTPDLGRIFDSAQEIQKYRLGTAKKITKTLTNIQDFYLEAFCISAHYSLKLNYDADNYMNYYKKYLQKMKKYRKNLEDEELTQENVFKTSNIFILLSSQINDAGKIIYCTKSIEKALGGDVQSYVGKNISNIVAPCIQNVFETIYRSFTDKNEQEYFGNGLSMRGYVCHKNGFLVETDLFLDIHPYMTQGFCLGLILRPIETTKDILLVNQYGQIECATKNISQTLNLPFHQKSSSRLKISISQVSEELSRASEAFNIMASKENHKKYWKNEKMFETKFTYASNLQTETINRSSFDKKFDSFIKRVTIEEAPELYHTFNSKGKNIVLNAISLNKTVTFHCTMKNSFFGSSLIKVVTFEKSEKDEDSSNTPTGSCKSFISQSKEMGQIQNPIAGSDSFLSEDEKVDGWIDFRTLHKDPCSKKIASSSENESLFSTAVVRYSTKDQQRTYLKNEQVKQTQEVRAENTKMNTNCFKTKSFSENSINSLGEKQDINIVTENWINKMPNENHSSQFSHQNYLIKAVKVALEAKYYPKRLQIIYFLLYILLIIIFTSQFNFKVMLSQGISDLKTIKDIVSSSELRNRLLTRIHYTCSLISEIENGNIDANLALVKPTEEYINDLEEYLVRLIDGTQKLASSLHFLNEEASKKFFKKDVRMVDTLDTFIYLNSFQATESLVQAGLRAVNTMRLNFSESQKDTLYVLSNSLNDLLAQNEAVSDIFMKSLDEKVTKINQTVQGYMLTIIAMIIVVTIFFMLVIAKHYQLEKRNLISVTKLDHKKVMIILKRLYSFMEMLENEKEFAEKEKSFAKNLTMNDEREHTKQNIKSRSKIPNRKGLSRKYYFYAARFFGLMAMLTLSVVLNLISGRDAIRSIEIAQDQLFFSQRLRSQVSLLGVMSQELIIGNDTTLIHNNPTSVQFEKSIRELNYMTNDISRIFVWENPYYDLEIHVMFFIDGCAYLEEDEEDDGFFLCNKLREESIKTDILSLLNLLENVMKQIFESFEISNKSPEALKHLESENLENTLSIFNVLMVEINWIAEDIEFDLQIDLDGADSTRNRIFGAFTVIFILLGFLLWVCLLRGFKEADNKFKRVLQVFPPHIILSNIMLKTYLMNTTNGVLDFIKNEI